MKYIFTLLLLILTIQIPRAQEKTMCITVDDLPVVPYGIDDHDFHLEITKSLINTFDQFEIPAIGYVNESKLYNNDEVDSAKVKLLEMWLQNGYELGNHTFSHKNYHQIPFEEFTDDVLKGEKVSKKLSKEYGRSYQFFRHPYLRIGNSQAHADSLVDFLQTHGYRVAPVTIDNEDYIFAKAYHNAFKQDDGELMKKIGEAYIEYMTQKMKFYEASSEKLFDRNIAQTLLIHANLLNAHYLDDLAGVYKQHGYRFISQSEVLEDPAYRTPVTRYGNWGISWIDRWAISRKVGREFFEGDPATPDFIRNIAN
ncbi:polysaccharide deacetylase family protein [Gracilimonas tropica]|uniref:polysaccharide deacetylase family protein n=1 Tax=Gracilimonas tropica TaxID=454600 RepID=UPI000360AEE0|nr:polysaccharide deacetylase family protein [Gracilimonas tropica]